ncbi:MAG: hypothetical protein HC855_02015 [Rhizobiales bacterium]|nr:hypothetical protein [Hyphomicrobiales bacterium]
MPIHEPLTIGCKRQVAAKLCVAVLEHGDRLGVGASVLMAAAAKPALGGQRLAMLDEFARLIGLAFQIQDDILDVEGDPQTLGKATGADRAKNKPTYPHVLGMQAAKQRCRDLHAQAVRSLDDFGPGADQLRWLADFVVERDT